MCIRDRLLEGAKNLEKHGFSVDIVVTHEPPTRIKGFLQLKDYDLSLIHIWFKDISVSDIKKWVSIEAVEDTAIINLTVTTPNADVSYGIATVSYTHLKEP